MTRTGTIVQNLDGDDVDEVRIMDLDSYETFDVNVGEDIGPLSEDDEVEYEKDSSARHGYTIIAVNE